MTQQNKDKKGEKLLNYDQLIPVYKKDFFRYRKYETIPMVTTKQNPEAEILGRE